MAERERGIVISMTNLHVVTERIMLKEMSFYAEEMSFYAEKINVHQSTEKGLGVGYRHI